METRWLHAFVAVAEELHFGRAASRLQMAQSPLSQMIRKLEKDIGVKLFERSTRSVALTSGGHAFLPHAYRVIENMETARHATRASSGASTDESRSGSPECSTIKHFRRSPARCVSAIRKSN